MQNVEINIFYENIKFKLNQIKIIKNWIEKTIVQEGRSLGYLNFIFCDDEYLLKMNHDYLQHDYYTDIITFDQSEGNIVNGDIFISVDRARENAKFYKQNFFKEIHRLMIHGTLHLLGYPDKAMKEKELMTTKEDYYLEKLVLK